MLRAISIEDNMAKRMSAPNISPRSHDDDSSSLRSSKKTLLDHSQLIPNKKLKTITSDPSPTIAPAAQDMVYGNLPGVSKPVSRVIYGTLFLHNVENPNALLDSVRVSYFLFPCDQTCLSATND